MTKQNLETKMQNAAIWDAHLVDSYKSAKKEHTSSWVSWGKTRLRSENRKDTAINAATQVASVAGLTTGAIGGAGVALGAFTAAAAGSASLAAAAVTLYALPAVITVAAIGYWGYNKNEHNEVNQEIRTYWYGNQTNLQQLVTLDKALKWLGWFGDEGIGNMAHLKDKATEAKAAFDRKVRELETLKAGLITKEANVAAKVAPLGATPAQIATIQANKVSALQQITREKDALRDKYLELAKDLQYIKYRLERVLMYHDMLDLTVRSLLEAKKVDLDNLRLGIPQAYQGQLDSYHALGEKMVLLG